MPCGVLVGVFIGALDGVLVGVFIEVFILIGEPVPIDELLLLLSRPLSPEEMVLVCPAATIDARSNRTSHTCTDPSTDPVTTTDPSSLTLKH
jgi:hypothetical protein